MNLYRHAQQAFVSVLEQTHGRVLTAEHAQQRDEIRSAGNILHCASLYSLRETPHVFLPNNPAFVGKDAVLGSEFMLPDQFTYIEDGVSGVALVDVLKNQKGTKSKRAFLLIESALARHITSVTNFSECFQALVETPEVYDESIWVHAGFIGEMDPMLPSEPIDARFQVELSIRSLILIEKSGAVRVCVNPYSPKTGESGVCNSGIAVDKSLALASEIAGNLRCGMRELAYLQASKDSIDCKVRLEREGQ